MSFTHPPLLKHIIWIITQPLYPGPGAEDSDSAASAPERGQVRGRDGLRGAVQDRVHRQDGGGPRQEVRLVVMKIV